MDPAGICSVSLSLKGLSNVSTTTLGDDKGVVECLKNAVTFNTRFGCMDASKEVLQGESKPSFRKHYSHDKLQTEDVSKMAPVVLVADTSFRRRN